MAWGKSLPAHLGTWGQVEGWGSPLQWGRTRLRGLAILNGSRMMGRPSNQIPAPQGLLAIALQGSVGTEMGCFGSTLGLQEGEVSCVTAACDSLNPIHLYTDCWFLLRSSLTQTHLPENPPGAS